MLDPAITGKSLGEHFPTQICIFSVCITKEALSKCVLLSEEDKGGKMAAADSVQQRRQYRRQNQQSSSGMDTDYMLFLSAYPNKNI